jgi:hypothetical protein
MAGDDPRMDMAAKVAGSRPGWSSTTSLDAREPLADRRGTLEQLSNWLEGVR